MRSWRVVAWIAVGVLSVSCSHLRKAEGGTPAPAAETEELGPDQRVARAQVLCDQGRYEAAAQVLAPLIGTDHEPERVAALQARISQRLGEERQAAATDHTLLEDLRGTERRAVLKAASRRLDEVGKLLREGKREEAEDALKPLVGTDLFPQEVSRLRKELQDAAIDARIALSQTETERRAVREVNGRLILPSTYGETIVIDRNTILDELPASPMDDVLMQVQPEIALEGLDLGGLVAGLRQIWGDLNIVVDQAVLENSQDKALSIYAKNVTLREVLSYIARNMGVDFHVGMNMIWITESELAEPGGPQLETRVYHIQHGFIPVMGPAQGGQGGGAAPPPEDTELEEAIDSIFAESPSNAMYRVFRNRNLLLVRNTRENIRIIEELIREFDRQPLQVLIEARFLTIGSTDLRELGVDLKSVMQRGVSDATVDGVSAADFSSSVMALTGSSGFEDFANAAFGGNVGVAGIIGNYAYEAIIHLLEKQGTATTLSAPRVTVLNNQTARIRDGDIVLYFEEYEAVDPPDIDNDDGTTTVDVNSYVYPSGNPEELELGLTLETKVSIGEDGRTVMLALRPEVTELVRWETYETAGNSDYNNDNTNTDGDTETSLIRLPVTSTSSVETAVVVHSQETVVLGGTLKTNRADTVSRTPILGRIPLIGFFFRHTEKQEEPQHLLIFVTATVINEDGRFVQYQRPEDR